ncbi:MAG: hypothetical protein QUS08_08165 [Methanothrix sp.]|nr:hypothetical protein [Methanothrix sp.]
MKYAKLLMALLVASILTMPALSMPDGRLDDRAPRSMMDGKCNGPAFGQPGPVKDGCPPCGEGPRPMTDGKPAPAGQEDGQAMVEEIGKN